MNHQKLSSILLAASLVGCSSDSANEIAPVVSPPPSIEIDSANASLIAKASYFAALDSGDLDELQDNVDLATNSSSDGGKISEAVAKVGAGSTSSSVPIPRTSVSCSEAGSVSISGEISDPVTPTLTAGDFFEFDFRMCNDGDGEEINGKLRADIDTFSGDYANELYALATTFRLTRLQVTEGLEITTAHGDVSVSLNTLNAPFVSTSIGGNQIILDENSASIDLTNYSADLTLDDNAAPAVFTLGAGGTVTIESPELAGTIKYSTPVTFQGFEGDFPHAGEFVVDGLGSRLKLEVVDNVDVLLHVDNEADGTYDEVIATTWEALLG